MAVTRRWDVGGAAYFLGKAFRSFKLRCGLVGAKDGKARAAQAIAKTADQRCFWPDHDKPDSIIPAKGHNRRMVVNIKINKLRFLRYSGVAGCGKKRITNFRLRQLPCKGMFAPARTDEQDIHE